MRGLRLLTFLAVLSMAIPASTQDIHFTMFDMAPLNVNPAFAGAFYGSFRVGGIVRDQAFTVSEIGDFKTASVYADAPLMKGFGKYHWIGVGFGFFYDVSGTADVQFRGMLPSAAYHIAFNKERKTKITLGVQFASYTKQVGSEGLDFEDSFVNGVFQNSTMEPEMGVIDVNDNSINAGILFKSELNENTNIQLGVALHNITEVSLTGIDSISTNPINEHESRLAFHGNYSFKLNEQWTITPGFLYQTMGPSDEIAIQSWGSYLIDPEKELALRFGLGYRLRDAVEIMVGIDRGPLRAGIAYDLSTSDITNINNGNGAIEIGVSYIARIFKRPNPDREIICPRL